MSTDRALFCLLQNGDRDAAITELFERYSKLIYSIAFKVLRDTGAAEDVTQELFISIWRRPPLISSLNESLTRWFMVTAKNRAISALRTRKPEDCLDESVSRCTYNPLEQMEGHLDAGWVRQVVDALPADQKATMVFAFFDGLTHAEIAARTGDALGTVKTRIRAGLKVVKHNLRAQTANPVEMGTP